MTKNLKEQSDAYKGECPKRCLLDCFVLRLLWAIGTFAILIFVLSITIYLLDRLNIVQRSLVCFKPYAASLPWILLIVFATLLLCIPSVTSEIKRLVRRVRTFKDWMSFFPDRETENDEALYEIENETAHSEQTKPGSDGDAPSNVQRPTPDNLLASILIKARVIRLRKNLIIQMHAGRFDSIVAERNFRLAGSNVHFDACLRKGDDLLLVKVIPILSVPCAETVSELLALANNLPQEPKINLHLIVYSTPKMMSPERQNLVSIIEQQVSACKQIGVFRYSVTEDNAVKPDEYNS